MACRVVVWGSGNVGRHAIIGVDSHPGLALAGVWVSGPAKAGRDAGELAGLDRNLGVTATTDPEAILALGPDCVVYAASGDDRVFAAVRDLEKLLAAGIDVVAASPGFLQFPFGTAPAPVVDRLRKAAEAGGSSLFVSGIDPGFANDSLPLLCSGLCERIDQVRCLEILDYSTYDNAKLVFGMMGFGRRPEDLPMLLQPGVLTLAWGAALRQLAAGLGVALDGIEERHERLLAPEAFRVASGTIEAGTVAAMRFELVGKAAGVPTLVVEHVTRLRPDLGPDWPQAAGSGGYRVEIRGEPNLTVDLKLSGSNGDPYTGGLKATAMRLVNAIPAVVAAKPGIVTALDLPPIAGRASPVRRAAG